MLTQENTEFNSVAISLRFGYFFHRLTGLYGYLIVFARISMINTLYICVSRTRTAYILTFIT